ncbi:hypothetical protein LITTLEE_213 [Mycobacterium phage LittleE]|uniref:Uncharacterized protein n=4 Tax=Omegavirus TaxID=1623292 RepID=A0A3S9UB94_9CAUD|nr:hypothetical protein CM09_gp208 [Mycobacterium phage Courthouse]YP_009047008.1 hypothetical protein N857_gp212 [Mycobacterium phage Wanda]YP_009205347.1 hypothetical protein AVT17_gp213 [Mycobacterium phage Ariel]YP_009637123.1 hypothetical protein FGG27_gp207 [Mycobacterium phage LittleE]ATN89924.1 hypothetical protein SEA_KLEIN_218 [Mycobacterium phage Klein]ATS93050.1 hypothetical protein SEA_SUPERPHIKIMAN_212 [Mycobacterium phage Superphikiman]AWH14021.1 hypothetical protein SEA_HALLEY
MSATHYCTYCDFYSRKWDGTRAPNSKVYTGTRKQVMAHANVHPIGTPYDMVLPLPQAPYAEVQR